MRQFVYRFIIKINLLKKHAENTWEMEVSPDYIFTECFEPTLVQHSKYIGQNHICCRRVSMPCPWTCGSRKQVGQRLYWANDGYRRNSSNRCGPGASQPALQLWSLPPSASPGRGPGPGPGPGSAVTGLRCLLQPCPSFSHKCLLGTEV